MATHLRALGYLRVSGKSQVEGDGFERQRLAIKSYAKAHNIQIVQWFEEKGISGKSEWTNRPAWVEMIGTLNGVKTILIEKLDRLARDLFTQEYILRDLAKRDVRLLTAAGEDTGEEDPTRVLFRQILGAISSYDRSMIVAKLKGARERMKAKTGSCEGRKKFGHYPGEEKTLATMKRLQSQGDNPSQIARALNDEEIPTRTNGKWHPYTVTRILAAQGVR